MNKTEEFVISAIKAISSKFNELTIEYQIFRSEVHVVKISPSCKYNETFESLLDDFVWDFSENFIGESLIFVDEFEDIFILDAPIYTVEPKEFIFEYSVTDKMDIKTEDSIINYPAFSEADSHTVNTTNQYSLAA